MDCKAIRPLISYYYDGEATPEERVQVEQHLAGCADCRQVLAQYRAMGSEIRDMAMPVPPSGLHRDVWRAIEAQQASTPRWKQVATPSQAKVVDIEAARKQKRQSLVTTLSRSGGGWARAVPAALIIAVLGVMLIVFILIQQGRIPRNELAWLVDPGPFSDYGTVLQVSFNKQGVVAEDAKQHTWVQEMDGDKVATAPTFEDNVLTLNPIEHWQANTRYQVYIDAQRIGLGVVNSQLADAPIILEFSTVDNTPTPTNTSVPPTMTATVAPTNTVEPTLEPTATAVIVEPTPPIVEPSATSQPVEPSAEPTDTPRPQPTNTRKPVPTSTPEPPRPTSTPVVEPTATEPAPTATATVPAPTATPVPPTATPTPNQPCSVMPVNGFGLIWDTNADVRRKLGCAQEVEYAILEAVHERFAGGYMFWRADTKKIYVFFGNPNLDTLGTWAEYNDTWVEGTPEPTAVPGSPLPPSGQFIPVRGFGKLWHENKDVQTRLGFALETEQPVTGAFQTFENGYGLWTNNKVIRFMYKDTNLWERFTDTYVMPTPSATPR